MSQPVNSEAIREHHLGHPLGPCYSKTPTDAPQPEPVWWLDQCGMHFCKNHLASLCVMQNFPDKELNA